MCPPSPCDASLREAASSSLRLRAGRFPCSAEESNVNAPAAILHAFTSTCIFCESWWNLVITLHMRSNLHCPATTTDESDSSCHAFFNCSRSSGSSGFLQRRFAKKYNSPRHIHRHHRQRGYRKEQGRRHTLGYCVRTALLCPKKLMSVVVHTHPCCPCHLQTLVHVRTLR